MSKLNLDDLAVETFEAMDADLDASRKHELFASTLRTCADTNCGKSYCVSSPCAC